jgi:PEP-CTERM motif
MKKLLLTIGLAAIGVSAFAQGSFLFGGPARYVWDNWSTVSTGLPRADASNNVAFLIGTGTPLVDAIMTSVPTNHTTAINGVAAWTSILNDPNFKLATNGASGLIVVGTTTLVGGFTSGGSTFTVPGTAAGGGVITLYVIGWSYLYANPFLAQAANSPVGWSAPINYAYGAGPVPGPAGTPGAIGDTLIQFGVAPVPEPATFALVGLGAAALLIFRRRKQ